MFALLFSLACLAATAPAALETSPIPTTSGDTFFGDQMAGHAEISHLPRIKAPLYSALVAYSAAVGMALHAPAYAMLLYYVAGLSVYYCWHRLAHCAAAGDIYKVHMEHHHEHFPPDDFYGDSSGAVEAIYGEPTPTLLGLLKDTKQGRVRWSHEGSLVAAFVVLLLGGQYAAHCSWWVTLAAAVMYAVMATIGTAMHMSYHVRNFEMERFAWYRELRTLHLIHHMRNANFAMVNTTIDLAYGSLVVVAPDLRDRRVRRKSRSTAACLRPKLSSMARRFCPLLR